MKKLNQLKPDDYLLWAGEDGWTYHETACLLHGIKPFSCPDLFECGLREDQKSIPLRIRPISRTFEAIFGIANKGTDSGVVASNERFHPFKMLLVLYQKGMVPVDKNPLLLKCVNERHFRERGAYLLPQFMEKQEAFNEKTSIVAENTTLPNIKENNTEKKHSSRKENNSLKAIGLMAILLARTCIKYTNGQKVNASKIAEAILQLAEDMDISPDDTDGLKSLNRDIKKGIEYLEKTYGITLEKQFITKK